MNLAENINTWHHLNKSVQLKERYDYAQSKLKYFNGRCEILGVLLNIVDVHGLTQEQFKNTVDIVGNIIIAKSVDARIINMLSENLAGFICVLAKNNNMNLKEFRDYIITNKVTAKDFYLLLVKSLKEYCIKVENNV